MFFFPELFLLARGIVPKSTFIIIWCRICSYHLGKSGFFSFFFKCKLRERKIQQKPLHPAASAALVLEKGKWRQIRVKGFPSLSFPTLTKQIVWALTKPSKVVLLTNTGSPLTGRRISIDCLETWPFSVI